MINTTNVLGIMLLILTITGCSVVLICTWNYAFGAETTNITVIDSSVTDIHQYLEEIKYDTCHVIFDIYNLTSYYRCIGQ